ncbi:MAG TPA: protein YgfX [Burkholderiales bacterium]
MRFELQPSRLLAAAILAAHLAAGTALLVVLPGVKGLLLAAALGALGAAAAWSRALLRSSHSVRAIEIQGAEARFELASGEVRSAPVSARRYVARYLVTLPLGAPLARTLLVTADMLAPREFRRLRIWAVWNRLPSESRAVAPAQLTA